MLGLDVETGGDGEALSDELRDLARPLVVEELRRQRIEELRSWRRDASHRLDEIARDSADSEVRGLLEGLSDAARDLAALYAANRDWDRAVEAGQEAVRLRRDRALDLTGEVLEADPDTYVQLAHATFMRRPRSGEPRRVLSEAQRLAPDSVEVARALAEHSLLDGDRGAAREAIRGLEALPEIATSILPRVDPDAAADAAPELADPANFYTYRNTLRSNAAFDDLDVQFEALAEIAKDPNHKLPNEFRALWDAATAAVGSAETARAIEDRSLPTEAVRDRAGAWKFEPRDAGEDGGVVASAGRAGRRTEVAARRRATKVFADAESEVVLSKADEEMILAAATAGGRAVDAWLAWSRANAEFRHARYANAAQAYGACQLAVLRYLHAADENYKPPTTAESVAAALDAELRALVTGENLSNVIRTVFNGRFGEQSLDGLLARDWVAPTEVHDGYAPYASATEFLRAYKNLRAKIDENVTAPLLLVGTVFARLGIAESLLLHGEHGEAAKQCDTLLILDAELTLLSQAVEVPFVKITRARIHLALADLLYRRGTTAAARAEYASVSEVFDDAHHQAYVEMLDRGIAELTSQVGELVGAPKVVIDPQTGAQKVQGVNLHPLAVAGSEGVIARLPTSAERQKLAVLGMDVPVETISGRDGTLPNARRGAAPGERILAFTSTEANAALWHVLMEARAGMTRIDAGLNYLGYRDDYVSPLRFQFLLDRARYFAEHARSTRRDYVNFLSNAENEQFRELGASQAAALEASNIRIESARVEQARLESETANKSKGLADLANRNASQRRQNYNEFAEAAEAAGTWMMIGSIASAVGSVASAFASPIAGGKTALDLVFKSATQDASTTVGEQRRAGASVGGAAAGGVGAILSEIGRQQIAGAEREIEKKNLDLAIAESEQAAAVAEAQLAVAQQAMLAASLQHSAALLRHDFAVQTLAFLSERTLNAEAWYRLARLIKGVSDTYLRYATEAAFLAEQAYEFEADKQLNVIRFDYGTSDGDEMLAADFLLRDLDALEHDLITTKREREQHVRCVISLARDFPDTLDQLREQGEAIATIPLRLLERRFPGLYNLRIGTVDLMPVALMDPTRFSVQLTYTGTSQVRMRGNKDEITGPSVPSWSPPLDAEWPVKARLSEPTTAVFSGLSRSEEQSVFPFQFANQRNAFEGYGAAGSWHIDMSMHENRIDPGSLADVLLTLDLSSYHDPTLRLAVEEVLDAKQTLTQSLSARTLFPDAFYDFQQSGRLALDVGADLLTVAGIAERVRNVGVVAKPAARDFAFDALRSTYRVDFEVKDGNVEVKSPLPAITIAISRLKVTVTVGALAPGATAQIDFGEGDGPAAATSHTYRQPGRYKVSVRVTGGERVDTFDAEVSVAADRDLVPPETGLPKLVGSASPSGRTRVVASVEGAVRPVTATWAIVGRSDLRRGDTTFDLYPGSYTLLFVAARTLNVRVAAAQRPGTPPPLPAQLLTLSTNRRFDGDTEVAPEGRNALALQLFGPPNVSNVLRPMDTWLLELGVADNDFLGSVENGLPSLALDVVDDVLLSLEYDAAPARRGRRLPPAAISLDPPQRTVTVGSPYSVTARVVDPISQPTPGALVRFEVQGANQPQPTAAVTGGNGTASFTYVGSTPGNDKITAYVDIDEDGQRDPGEPVVQASCTYAAQPPKTATLTLSSSADVVGGTYTATASVTDAANKPMANLLVGLVVQGPNAQQQALRTDGLGKVTFTLAGSKVGEDTLTAFADVNEDGVRQPTEVSAQTKHVFTGRPAARVNLTPAEGETLPGLPYTVTATVVDELADPVQDATVQFRRAGDNGEELKPIKTSAAGTAAYTYTAAAVGTDTIDAFVDVNGNGTRDVGEPVAVQATLHVRVPPAQVTLEGEAQSLVRDPRTVTAIVVDAQGDGLRNIPVRFRRQGPDGDLQERVVTGSDGKATLTYTPMNVGSETISAFADTNDNGSVDAGEIVAEDDLHVTIVRRPTTRLDLAPASGASRAGEEWALAATVADDLGQRVANALVRLVASRAGAELKRADVRTDANGAAGFAYKPTVGKETIYAYVDTNEDGARQPSEPDATGSHSSTVPSFIGTARDHLSAAVTSAGLKMGGVTDTTGRNPDPTARPPLIILGVKVIGQSLAPGSEAEPGATLSATVKGTWGRPE